VTDIVVGIHDRGAVTALTLVSEKLVTDDRAFLQDPLHTLSPFTLPLNSLVEELRCRERDPGNEFAWRLKNREELPRSAPSFSLANDIILQKKGEFRESAVVAGSLSPLFCW
jgi:hypothetical protein